MLDCCSIVIHFAVYEYYSLLTWNEHHHWHRSRCTFVKLLEWCNVIIRLWSLLCHSTALLVEGHVLEELKIMLVPRSEYDQREIRLTFWVYETVVEVAMIAVMWWGDEEGRKRLFPDLEGGMKTSQKRTWIAIKKIYGEERKWKWTREQQSFLIGRHGGVNR